jgi:TldD protein
MYKFHPHFYSDIRIEESTMAYYSFQQGETDNFINRKKKGAFLRVFDGNRWYYGSTTEMDQIQQELDRLYESGTPNPKINELPIVKRMPSKNASKIEFKGCKVTDISTDSKLELLKEHFHLFQANKRITTWTAIYSDTYKTKRIINSKGADITSDWQICGYYYMMTMSEGEKIFQKGHDMTSDRFANLHMETEEIELFLQKSEFFLLNSKPIVPGKYPTILSPDVAGVFAHESFGHKSEADFMLGDENMKNEWQIGKKVGAENLTIVDDGNVPGSGYIGFDDEGLPPVKTYLIHNGILTGRLHNIETAISLEEEPTGNARAISFEFEPIVRMTSTFIEPGTLTKDELFAKVKEGIFIEDIKHGSGMSTFTLAPSEAYYIKDGKIAYPVEIAVVTGSVFETLGRIEGLSNIHEIKSGFLGGCGKMGQYPLPVSFGGPYVLISELNVQ